MQIVLSRDKSILDESTVTNVSRGTGNRNKRIINGYHSFNSKQNLSFACDTCALVSSSGTLLGSKSGNDIDKYPCVFRMNDAPTLTYEKDVGSKTTARVVAHSAVKAITDYLQYNTLGNQEANSTTFIVWGPDRNMKHGGVAYQMLRYLEVKYPFIKLFIYDPQTVAYADKIFEKETGRPRIGSGSYLSTGWFTFLLMKKVCGRIAVYGMVEEQHCNKKILNPKLIDAPYHYYRPLGPKQCTTYIAHERAKFGAHRFITEKKVFKKWAKEWGNVEFHSPQWNLSDI